MSRKIIHLDMDCFFAAVEIRDQPTLRGQPVAVGGSPQHRGVICASNYEARWYGVFSAMASAKALRLCPQLQLIAPDFAKYWQVSQAIQHIFQMYTEQVEPLSLDEAYLDVTGSPHCQGSATWLATLLRQHIWREQQLTASAGVAPNKLLAKIASDWCKPNGQWVIEPSQVADFIAQLPVHKLYGVGAVTAGKLANLGIHTCRQLQAWSRPVLMEHFGRFGDRLYEYCRGHDERPVKPERIRKSLSLEQTFSHDLPSLAACRQALPALYGELERRLQRRQMTHITKQFVKIKFNDWQQTTVESPSEQLTLSLFEQLMMKGYQRANQPVRLLGIGVKLGFEKIQRNFDFSTTDNISI